MNIFYPTLKSLKQKLQIKPINTGKLSTHNGQACGIVFDDIERLHALVGQNNCVHLKSGTEFSTTQYRGQIKDYKEFGGCKTTLDRYKSKEEQFLSICKTIAFEELLEVHPFVQHIKTLPPLGENPLCINLTGISQHYGLDTDYLDITNNFDVASFFATCKYEDRKYIPYYHSSELGIIYKMQEFFTPPFNKDESNIEIEYLGWQPLPRPEQQRASVLQMKKDTDLNNIKCVEKHYFKHSISQSKNIWKKFDEGKLLFPNDSAADLANECKKLNSFTQNQIDRAFERFESWTEKQQDKALLLEKLQIDVIDNNGLSWNNMVETKKEYWEEKFNQTVSKVGFRFSCDHLQLD